MLSGRDATGKWKARRLMERAEEVDTGFPVPAQLQTNVRVCNGQCVVWFES